MKIGILGAENSHTAHFCNTINGGDRYGDERIAYMYGGDAPETAADLCARFGIELRASEDEVIEKSDGIVITYRSGSRHFEPAMKAVKAGKPLFNDKPFCTSSALCRELVATAAKNGVPVTGGSNLKGLPGIAELKPLVKPGTTTVISFVGDFESAYDGYWFYGIHTAELCTLLCGDNFTGVSSFRNGKAVISTVRYPDRTCVICVHPDTKDLTITVSGPDGTVCRNLPLNYQSVGPDEFVTMAKTGVMPRPLAFYEGAVRLVEAVIASVNKAGQPAD